MDGEGGGGAVVNKSSTRPTEQVGPLPSYGCSSSPARSLELHFSYKQYNTASFGGKQIIGLQTNITAIQSDNFF